MGATTTQTYSTKLDTEEHEQKPQQKREQKPYWEVKNIESKEAKSNIIISLTVCKKCTINKNGNVRKDENNNRAMTKMQSRFWNRREQNEWLERQRAKSTEASVEEMS